MTAVIVNVDSILRIYNRFSKLIIFEPMVNKLAKAKASPYQILIATMMSARTKDEVTEKACERLFSKFPDAKTMLTANIKQIETLIYPVGFYKTKAKHIISISKKILEEYKGKVPYEKEKLMELPGVGLKTASLVIAEGFGIPDICVDTHVHRISNRLGFVKTKTPEETYERLKTLLPKKLWIKTNYYMVSYGKTICTPLRPKCNKCKISSDCKKIGV